MALLFNSPPGPFFLPNFAQVCNWGTGARPRASPSTCVHGERHGGRRGGGGDGDAPSRSRTLSTQGGPGPRQARTVQGVLLSPSSMTERSIQHTAGAAGGCFEVVGDGSALAPTALPPSPSLLALPQAAHPGRRATRRPLRRSRVRGLDARGLASFAAACSACLAAAHDELRAALHAAVTRCLVPDSGPQS